MSWQLLTILSVFFASFSILLQRVVLKHKEISPVTLAIFFQLSVAALMILYAFFTQTLIFPNIVPLLPNLLLMTLFYAFGNIFLLKAIETTQISLVAILFSTRAVFSVLVSTIVLREVFTGGQMVGTLLIIAGIIIVNIHGVKLRFGKGEIYALIAALLFGAEVINDKILLTSFTVHSYLIVNFLFPALATAILYPRFLLQGNRLLAKPVRIPYVLICILFSLSALTFFTALQIAPNVSQISVINITNVIVTVLLAIIFLKERNAMGKKIIGAILAFIGLLLVI